MEALLKAVHAMDFRMCLNLSTVGHLAYESQLEISAQAGFKAIGLRINRLEEYLDEFLECLFKRGCKGYYSLEIFNKDYPLEDPLEICIRAKSSMENLLTGYAQKLEKGR